LQKVTTSEPKTLQKVTTLWLKILQKVTAITDKQANISKLIKNEGINHKSGIYVKGNRKPFRLTIALLLNYIIDLKC